MYYGSDIYAPDKFPTRSERIPIEKYSKHQAVLMYLNQSDTSTSALQLGSRPVNFSDKSAVVYPEKYLNFSTTKGTVNWSTTAINGGHIKIYKVVGLR